MCASYGLQVEAADIHYGFSVIDDKAQTAALAGWLEEFRDEPAKPTGVHRRNLNPIVRERVSAHSDSEGERLRSVDLAWWKLWVRGEPAKFPAINARVEGLVGSGAWSAPLKSRRGLVPATEYYEKGHRFRLPDGARRPVRLRRPLERREDPEPRDRGGGVDGVVRDRDAAGIPAHRRDPRPHAVDRAARPLRRVARPDAHGRPGSARRGRRGEPAARRKAGDLAL